MSESQERDVIRQEMGVGHRAQGIDVQRVAPDGVNTGVGLGSRAECLVVESHHLATLCIVEVVVHILQGISAIGAWGDTFHDKVATTVSTRDAQQRLGLESRVGEVIVKSHHHTLDRFKVAGIKHIAGHLKGINLLACGESIGVRPHRIAFIIISDGVTEVNGIGGVLLQRVLQLHNDFLARSLDLCHFQLRRRDDDFVCGILQFDELVEVDGDLLAFHVHRLVVRNTTDYLWRIVIIPSAIRTAHLGAGGNGQQPAGYVDEFLHALSFSSCSMVSRELLRRGTLC